LEPTAREIVILTRLLSSKIFYKLYASQVLHQSSSTSASIREIPTSFYVLLFIHQLNVTRTLLQLSSDSSTLTLCQTLAGGRTGVPGVTRSWGKRLREARSARSEVERTEAERPFFRDSIGVPSVLPKGSEELGEVESLVDIPNDVCTRGSKYLYTTKNPSHYEGSGVELGGDSEMVELTRNRLEPGDQGGID
jgi:hypothetical protein